jgi:hypothetical protein
MCINANKFQQGYQRRPHGCSRGRSLPREVHQPSRYWWYRQANRPADLQPDRDQRGLKVLQNRMRNLFKELWMYQPDFGLQETKRGVCCWLPVELFRLFSFSPAVSCHPCYDICFFLFSFFQYTRTCGLLHAYEKERSGRGSNLGQDTIETEDSAWLFLFWGGAHKALVFSLVEFLVYLDIYFKPTQTSVHPRDEGTQKHTSCAFAPVIRSTLGT